MAFPKPEVGLVISYSYLWREEAERGHVEGFKPRPCAIVVALIQEEGKPPRVVVAPITHSAPPDPERALEIPRQVKLHLGLDEERSWIVLDDFNVFAWPGFDLRLIPITGRYEYGLLPPALFQQMRRKYLELLSAGAVSEISRDEADG